MYRGRSDPFAVPSNATLSGAGWVSPRVLSLRRSSGSSAPGRGRVTRTRCDRCDCGERGQGRRSRIDVADRGRRPAGPRRRERAISPNVRSRRTEGGHMTTVPFAPSAADPAAALRLLERRFPATPVWFGPYTRNWWALSNDRLIEAETPRALGEAIAAAAE